MWGKTAFPTALKRANGCVGAAALHAQHSAHSAAVPLPSDGRPQAKATMLLRYALVSFTPATQHKLGSRNSAKRCLGVQHKMLLFCTGVRVWNILHICPFPNGDWDSPSKSTEKMYQFCHLNEVNNCGDWTFGEHVPQGGPPSSDVLPQMSRVSSHPGHLWNIFHNFFHYCLSVCLISEN